MWKDVISVYFSKLKKSPLFTEGSTQKLYNSSYFSTIDWFLAKCQSVEILLKLHHIKNVAWIS